AVLRAGRAIGLGAGALAEDLRVDAQLHQHGFGHRADRLDGGAGRDLEQNVAGVDQLAVAVLRAMRVVPAATLVRGRLGDVHFVAEQLFDGRGGGRVVRLV